MAPQFFRNFSQSGWTLPDSNPSLPALPPLHAVLDHCLITRWSLAVRPGAVRWARRSLDKAVVAQRRGGGGGGLTTGIVGCKTAGYRWGRVGEGNEQTWIGVFVVPFGGLQHLWCMKIRVPELPSSTGLAMQWHVWFGVGFSPV